MHQLIICSRHHGECVCLIDDDDKARVLAYRWYVNKAGYVTTIIADGRKRHGMKLHRFVMNAPDGIMVDHKYGNRLDNRKENLRLCVRSFNGANKRKEGHIYGVTWHKTAKRWCVNVGEGSKPGSYRGRFKDYNAAVNCYNHHLKAEYGEFASLNPCQPMSRSEWEAKRCRHRYASGYTHVYYSREKERWIAEYREGGKVKLRVPQQLTDKAASEVYNREIDQRQLPYPRSVPRTASVSADGHDEAVV